MLVFVSFALGKPHLKPAKFLPSIFSMVAIVDNGKPMFFDRHARAQGCTTVRRNEKARKLRGLFLCSKRNYFAGGGRLFATKFAYVNSAARCQSPTSSRYGRHDA
jgi:hypothetical protein